MATSIREQILQAIGTALTAVASSHGGIYLRKPRSPLTREQTPALVLLPELDTVTSQANDRTERQITLRVVAVARQAGTSGPEPETIADAMLASAHSALYSHKPLQSLIVKLQAADTDWADETFEVSVAWQPARYTITYRTQRADIATQG